MINLLKRLSELNSAKTTRLTEDTSMHHHAVVAKHELTKEASNGGYDLETTIDNPAWNGEDDNIPDTIEIGVNYTITGSYRPSTWGYHGGEPEEHPELDINSIVNLETGQDIHNLIDRDTLSRIEEEIWEQAEKSKDDDFDVPDDYDEDVNYENDSISPIHGGQRKEETMENLNLESLRYLAGVKNTLEECGMSPMQGTHTPASINITAGSGQELTGMLKDIMNLAGVQQVQPHHMPVDSPNAGPSTVVSAPPMAGAMGHQDSNAEMHHLMAIIDGPKEQEDSMNVSDEETDEGNERMYDTSPDEHVMDDPLAQFGDKPSGDRRPRQAGLPSANPMEATFKTLFAEYEKFIAEGATKMQPKGPAEVDVPAALRKQKRPGQAAAQAATDKRNASSGAKVWSSKRTEEGKKGKCCCDTDGEDQCPVHAKMDEERTMSRAAKGMMKYGKEGMKALAKAGKAGKDLDKVRDKYNKYDEAVNLKKDPNSDPGAEARLAAYQARQPKPTVYMDKNKLVKKPAVAKK
jgi:hypothetical protein